MNLGASAVTKETDSDNDKAAEDSASTSDEEKAVSPVKERAETGADNNKSDVIEVKGDFDVDKVVNDYFGIAEQVSTMWRWQTTRQTWWQVTARKDKEQQKDNNLNAIQQRIDSVFHTQQPKSNANEFTIEATSPEESHLSNVL